MLWPAALNGYPLVFGDTGVYLRDGITLHASWPRPPFYGVFMVPLHLGRSAWPVVAVQALLAAGMLQLAMRTVLPGLSPWALVPVAALLAACTSLPWFAAQLMPDLFGALMLLAVVLLVLAPERLGGFTRLILVLFAAGCIAMHQSFLPVAIAVAVVLLIVRATIYRVGVADLLRAAAVPVLALAVAVAANAVLMGIPSPSPYGKIFLMTRLIFDGPGARTLQRECPRPGWTMCSQKDAIPDNVEAFLFGDLYGQDSTLNRAGGYRVVAVQAMPIVLSTVAAEPLAVAWDAVRNTGRQFVSFATGDWLIVAMPAVAGAWAQSFPPAEVARFKAAKQQRLIPLLPDWLQAIHQGVGFVSLAVLAAGVVACWRTDRLLAGLCAGIVAGLLANAFVSGALSGVYDRYQSRFMWLPTFAALLMLLSWLRSVRDGGVGQHPQLPPDRVG